MLAQLGADNWVGLSAEGGGGARSDQLESFARAAVETPGLSGDSITAFHPEGVSEEYLATTRAWLATNEAGTDDALLVSSDQDVVVGDWYIPCWTSAPVLREAMVNPTCAEHGVLEGATGGFVRIGPVGWTGRVPRGPAVTAVGPMSLAPSAPVRR